MISGKGHQAHLAEKKIEVVWCQDLYRSLDKDGSLLMLHPLHNVLVASFWSDSSFEQTVG